MLKHEMTIVMICNCEQIETILQVNPTVKFVCGGEYGHTRATCLTIFYHKDLIYYYYFQIFG